MKRKNIGLLFTSGKFWMGGVIYILNVVHSLNKLEDNEKPNLFIFYNEFSKPFINEFDYPYIEFIQIKDLGLEIGYLLSIIFRRNFFENGIIDKYRLNGLFPLEHFPVKLRKNNFKAVAWVPDLQPKYYPEFFNRRNLLTRDIKTRFILKNANKMVLSSKSVLLQFKAHYNLKKDMDIHILRFASIINENELPSFEDIKKKYKLNSPYFIVSNQFWRHKDHITVFRAIKILKDKNIQCNFIFTGNMEDKRNTSYITDLKKQLQELDIDDCTNFIGLVKREEQLCVMKNSIAVVQPSLFEGWSTVLEDAKALGCQIIASDIAVHKEQLEDGANGFIFKAKDSEGLSVLLLAFINGEYIPKPIFSNYGQFVVNFARSFLSIFPR